ncbi:hypothetical protein F9278_41940 [Streptomyces phaeolivaceus]|uniref:Uncharacterized protein n=1 Tax=Streptomyces phaeolivaceus TaxID=2653200 RepID=A0A5P8KF71_9ACTN|nr:thioesterase family protein [Streptomyces phaeolivaceus]QFR01665.1 hypothetical protein F9278_41940 [Streptomyces phaeolivaceus]
MSASNITRESVRVHLRWRDLDAFGHLYHATMVELLDEARAAWIARFLSPEAGDGHVIARIDVSYLAEVTRADRWLEVGIAVDRIGTSSLVLSETVRNIADVVVAKSRTTVVMWDAAEHGARALSPAERGALAAEEA